MLATCTRPVGIIPKVAVFIPNQSEVTPAIPSQDAFEPFPYFLHSRRSIAQSATRNHVPSFLNLINCKGWKTNMACTKVALMLTWLRSITLNASWQTSNLFERRTGRFKEEQPIAQSILHLQWSAGELPHCLVARDPKRCLQAGRQRLHSHA